jgi:tetratricopeptide (TPR) repeat protein
MFNQPRPLSTWQPFALSVTLLISFGGLQVAFGQVPNPTLVTAVSRLEKSPDPPVNSLHSARRRPSRIFPRPSAKAGNDSQQEDIERFILAGNDARAKNDYDQALNNYRQAQNLNPKESRAFYGMGNLYSDLYCNDSAIDAYRKALDVKKDDLEALIGLGYAYAGKERYEEAEKQFEEARRLKPDSVEANIGLGRIYTTKGKYEKAIAQFNLIINPPGVAIKDKAVAHVALGDVYWKQANRQDALAQFKQAIQLKPDLAGAYLELGNAQASLGFSKLGSFASINEANMQDLEALRAAEKEALDNLEDARKFNYNHPNLHEYKALALAYQFRYEAAISELKDYFAEVENLEKLITPQIAKCSGGFDQLKANGYWYRAQVYFLEGYFEPDVRRKSEFFDKALEQFDQALKVKEDFAAAYMMRGVVYGYLKKHEEAIGQYNRAILFSTEEPVKASLYESIGLVHSILGRYEDALTNVQEAIRRDPNNPSFYDSLAVIYVSQGKLADSMTQLKKAAELRKENPSDPNPYYQLGSLYVIRFAKNRDEEDFKEAVRLLKKAVEIRPRFVFAYQGLGEVYRAHGNADEALANFNKASEYDPKNPAPLVNLALVYFELKHNSEAAISYLRKATEVKPDFADAYYQWGYVCLSRYVKDGNEEDFNAAVNKEKEAVRIKPDFADAYYSLGAIYGIRFTKIRNEADFNESIDALKKTIAIKPEYAIAYQGLGLAYLSHANADQALANFQRAIEYDPKSPINYYHLARVYFELKHDDEAAIKQLLKALEMDPKYVDAYSKLAEIYRGQKKYPEAIKYLTTAIEIAPTVPWAYKDLAKLYEAQGNNQDAIHYYEEAIKLLDTDDSSTRNLYLGRIARLRGQYAESIGLFQKLGAPFGADQSVFEIGVTYVVSRNKKAALEQYEQLVRLKSTSAEDLLKRINEMK